MSQCRTLLAIVTVALTGCADFMVRKPGPGQAVIINAYEGVIVSDVSNEKVAHGVRSLAIPAGERRIQVMQMRPRILRSDTTIYTYVVNVEEGRIYIIEEETPRRSFPIFGPAANWSQGRLIIVESKTRKPVGRRVDGEAQSSAARP